MDFSKTNAHLTIFIALLFACLVSNAGVQQNPLVKAIQLYDAEDYKQAEQLLKELLNEKPDDLMINYYYGACRTENKHYGTKEIIYLINGSTGETPLKTNYYLGVQYHAENSFDKALEHYTKYKNTSSNEEQAKIKLSEKIQQCYDKVNPFVNDEAIVAATVMPKPLPRETEITEYNPIITIDSLGAEDSNVAIDTVNTDSAKVNADNAELPKRHRKKEPILIDFKIDSEITYRSTAHFRTQRGLTLYEDALEEEEKLNQRTQQMDKWRVAYGKAKSFEEKQDIGQKILEAETAVYPEQSDINHIFSKAKTAEIEYWQNASFYEKEGFKAQLASYTNRNNGMPKAETIELDSSSYINSNLLLPNSEEPALTDKSTNDRLVYKIQLGAYSRGLPDYVKRLFDKLAYIRKIDNYTDEKGIVVYTTGMLSNYDDALKMKDQVRREGVQDAYIVPYYNGKRITLKEAKEIEKGK